MARLQEKYETELVPMLMEKLASAENFQDHP
jgi:hypothetical protein